MTTPERTRLKGAFSRCRWCNGYGCLACDEERRKFEEQQSKPIFTADRSDSEDMEALNRVFGLESLQHAFGPEGGGITEIERGAALESLLQALRKQRSIPATDGKESANG